MPLAPGFKEETMRARLVLIPLPLRALLAGAVLLGLFVTSTPAQQQAPGGCLPLPPPCATPTVPLPGQTAPPPGQTGMQPAPSTTMPSTTGADLSLGGGLSAAAGGATVALNGGGYVDDAIPYTHIRLRFDSAYNDNRPDRAEFFYPKCGCFGTPDAKGPPLPELRVDYQEYTSYFEYAFGNRLSAFIELPIRAINPEVNANHTGFGDMNVGGKFAFISSEDTVITFQGRVYIPTGDGREGLGTEHTSLEPALLLYQRLGDRLGFQAELRDWIPIGGSDFEGNVLRYGIAVTYLALNGQSFRVMPVGELVGWTVLGGQEEDNLTGLVKSASGDTIVNAKLGVRVGFGDLQERGLLSQSDLYVGYGRALTGAVWYKDIIRVEYRMRF
jgi:hypothetical protein